MDLLIANDFGVDESFIGTDYGFKRVNIGDALFQQSPWATMSIDTAGVSSAVPDISMIRSVPRLPVVRG